MIHNVKRLFWAGAILLASLATIDAAPLIPRDIFRPQSVTATAWSGNLDTMGIRVYFPLSTGDRIQELVSVTGKAGTQWARGNQLPSDGAFNIPVDTQISSANVNGYIRVFFFDSNDYLREFAWDGQGWSQGTLVYQVQGHSKKLASAAWLDANGAPNFSVWFVGSDGALTEATQAGSGSWVFNPVGSGKASGDGALYGTVALVNGVALKRVYYQDLSIDGSLRESTWNVLSTVTENTWADGITNAFPFSPTGSMTFTGAMTASDHLEHFFINPPSTLKIVEYVRAGSPIPQNWSQSVKTLAAEMQTGLPFSAVGYAFQNSVMTTDAMAVFYTATDGTLNQITYMTSGRPQWSTFSTQVAVF